MLSEVRVPLDQPSYLCILIHFADGKDAEVDGAEVQIELKFNAPNYSVAYHSCPTNCFKIHQYKSILNILLIQ